ncbi:hypothetical protein TNCV_3557571 [Trichonephila clavipes]|uniref:Uncharacterized protein n=1 Tax=Trichonephila clavipes TaxID=2585209 RepID=A0A8X6WD75_TRICX|nr:hypothetical protein TNCV_3557571 [Trichonephila clavipes]
MALKSNGLFESVFNGFFACIVDRWRHESGARRVWLFCTAMVTNVGRQVRSGYLPFWTRVLNRSSQDDCNNILKTSRTNDATHQMTQLLTCSPRIWYRSFAYSPKHWQWSMWRCDIYMNWYQHHVRDTNEGRKVRSGYFPFQTNPLPYLRRYLPPFHRTYLRRCSAQSSFKPSAFAPATSVESSGVVSLSIIIVTIRLHT